MKVTVSRLELYPHEEPTGWAVGFVCECANNKSFYVDTVVSHEDAADDEAAVAHAIETLGVGIKDRCAAIEAKSSLLGSDVSVQLGLDDEPVVDDTVDEG